MPEHNKQNMEYVGVIKVRSEDLGYARDELVNCGRCGRANPPDRSACIYCGTEAAGSSRVESRSPEGFRKPEAWENGFNVVLLGAADDHNVPATARFLDRDPGVIESALGAKGRVPIARLESEEEARAFGEHLHKFGLSTTIVSDVKLKSLRPNIRLRTVNFEGEVISATDFNTLERMSVSVDDIELMVSGRLFESRSNTIKKAKGKGQRKALSASETSSDESILDIYVRGLERGWRVRSKGFDFSGLGTSKSLLASENFQSLIEKLRANQPSARYLDEYSDVREVISEVWPDEIRTDFEGLKRAGIWKTGFSKQVITNNFDQFDRYSRLQWLLK